MLFKMKSKQRLVFYWIQNKVGNNKHPMNEIDIIIMKGIRHYQLSDIIHKFANRLWIMVILSNKANCVNVRCF